MFINYWHSQQATKETHTCLFPNRQNYRRSNARSPSSHSFTTRHFHFFPKPLFVLSYACVISITMASSASSLLRATRSRLSSSSYLSRTISSPPVRPSPSRSPAFSSSAAAARSSVNRWSHGVHWRSPFSLRPQIRAVAPFIERFHRKIATSGTSSFTPKLSDDFSTFFVWLI